jgi:hypothetical protein
MNKFFECCVKHRKTDEQGVNKVVTESYIVSALSFSEAESNINEQMKVYVGEDFRVVNIKLTNYSEIAAFEDTDVWFKSKISLLVYDENSGKEKKQNIYMLVQANSAREAYDNTIATLKGTVSDYSIPAVSETKIVEVFQYLGE